MFEEIEAAVRPQTGLQEGRREGSYENLCHLLHREDGPRPGHAHDGFHIVRVGRTLACVLMIEYSGILQ